MRRCRARDSPHEQLPISLSTRIRNRSRTAPRCRLRRTNCSLPVRLRLVPKRKRVLRQRSPVTVRTRHGYRTRRVEGSGSFSRSGCFHPNLQGVDLPESFGKRLFRHAFGHSLDQRQSPKTATAHRSQRNVAGQCLEDTEGRDLIFEYLRSRPSRLVVPKI